MTQKHRATILAIGTELTTGQITNRNAAWLSQKLTDLGADVVMHETVGLPSQYFRISSAPTIDGGTRNDSSIISRILE